MATRYGKVAQGGNVVARHSGTPEMATTITLANRQYQKAARVPLSAAACFTLHIPLALKLLEQLFSFPLELCVSDYAFIVQFGELTQTLGDLARILFRG